MRSVRQAVMTSRVLVAVSSRPKGSIEGRRPRQYSSILDLVTQEAADLQKTLDAPDRAKLGDYLESVREIERRVQKMEAQDLSSLELPEVQATKKA